MVKRGEVPVKTHPETMMKTLTVLAEEVIVVEKTGTTVKEVVAEEAEMMAVEILQLEQGVRLHQAAVLSMWRREWMGKR
jgi:hypothetical protein